MRKVRVGLLLMCLIFVMSSCKGENRQNTLIVGITEQFSGYFMPSEGFMNTVCDDTIRKLLHDGGIVTIDAFGEIKINDTNIKSYTRTEHENNDVTYTFEINDFSWSDGTPVTADDYLFAILLSASPQYQAAGAVDSTGEGLIGYWDYYQGEQKYFAGLKKLSDTSFSLTVDHNELPYYWELTFVSIVPYPMHALIQENETLVFDEHGIAFQGDMEAAVETFIGEYNDKLTPSYGPYVLENYESGQVTLKRNENYMGDANGNKPSIEKIIVKEVSDETAMQALINKEIDVLEPVMEKNTIDQGKKAVKEGKLQAVDFSRNGYGVMAMKANLNGTKEKEIRRALAYMVNRNQLIQHITGPYGTIIDSDYVPSQWMTKESDELKMSFAYTYSIAKANEQLDLSSYRYESDGKTPFDVNKASKNYLRYNEKKEPLQLRHLAVDGNAVSEIIEAQLMDASAKVGIDYQMERADETAVYDQLYYAKEKGLKENYQLFTFGIEYASIPDPYYASIACDYADTSANPSNFCDAHLDELIQQLRHTDSKDKEGFIRAWKAYLNYFNEVLPMLPLYTNTYTGFANPNLKNYHPTTYHTWADQVSQLSW